jgi:hypothetical protein
MCYCITTVIYIPYLTQSQNNSQEPKYLLDPKAPLPLICEVDWISASMLCITFKLRLRGGWRLGIRGVGGCSRGFIDSCNGGVFGSLYDTPIINLPQSVVLGA